MATLEERLDSLRKLIQDRNFLEGKGLSNEVNIRFFCYMPEEEMVVNNFVRQISHDDALNCNLKICNLYEIFLELCEDLDIVDAIADMEKSDGSNYLLEQLHSAIGEIEFVKKIEEKQLHEGEVLILTGVGDVNPFMRIHTLLESLQPHIVDTPILVMYPGTFDGRSVKLFNRLKANDYYRAFNVI